MALAESKPTPRLERIPPKDDLQTEPRLVPVTGVRASLQYDRSSVDGAMTMPFAAEQVAAALRTAASLVRARDPRLELVLWDGYRTVTTQQWIFDDYMRTVRAQHPHLPAAALRELTREFVSDPAGTFPHGTGGAVDVTLARDGVFLDMGTGFDDFSVQSARDYFRAHVPVDCVEQAAHERRELLRSCMERAGFVGLDSEWWHYELGTARWAAERSREPQLDRVLDPPVPEGPATADRLVPSRLPTLTTGAAQPFLTSADRANALAHRLPAHYYGRWSHPSAAALQDSLGRELFGEADTVLLPSGLAAAVVAVESVTPAGGSVLYAADVYYECELALEDAARHWGWTLHRVADVRDALVDGARPDVVYVDTPSNWHLRSVDLVALADQAHAAGARLVADVTLQPIRPEAARGVDLLVASLAKDVSLGYTMGGVVASALDPALIAVVAGRARAAGLVLAAETCHTIHTQLLSLRDRLVAKRIKVESVAAFLANHDAVAHVRVADPDLCEGLVGSQVVFHLVDPRDGAVMEMAVGHRALDPSAALHLACTFGTVITTIEHFASNARDRGCVVSRNEVSIPRDAVRLGVGSESAERIVSELAFVLNGPA